MDPEMQNAIKKQLILRAVATGILILFALVVFYYIQISQGRELSQGIVRSEASSEEMAMFARDLELPEILKGTFISAELRGNLDEVYRFTLTLSLDSREQVDAMLKARDLRRSIPARQPSTRSQMLFLSAGPKGKTRMVKRRNTFYGQTSICPKSGIPLNASSNGRIQGRRFKHFL